MITKSVLCILAFAVPYIASATSTEYRLTNTGTTVTTEMKGVGSTYDGLMTTYLSDRLVKALKDLPTVTSVQLTKAGEETVSEVYSYSGYRTRTRKSNLFVTLNIPTKVSLLMAVEESYNECVKSASQSVSDETGYSSSPSCSLSSSVKITGPISVYGAHANNSLAGFKEDDLKETQDLRFDLSKSYDQKDVTLRSSFNVNSMLFENVLAKFLKTFKAQGVELTVAGMTRQNVMLGTSRMVRMVNEKILEEKGGGK